MPKKTKRLRARKRAPDAIAAKVHGPTAYAFELLAEELERRAGGFRGEGWACTIIEVASAIRAVLNGKP